MRIDTILVSIAAAVAAVASVTTVIMFASDNAFAYLYAMGVAAVALITLFDLADQRRATIRRERDACMRRHPAGGRR